MDNLVDNVSREASEFLQSSINGFPQNLKLCFSSETKVVYDALNALVTDVNATAEVLRQKHIGVRLTYQHSHAVPWHKVCFRCSLNRPIALWSAGCSVVVTQSSQKSQNLQWRVLSLGRRCDRLLLFLLMLRRTAPLSPAVSHLTSVIH